MLSITTQNITRAQCIERDRTDPLAAARRRFMLNDGEIYLDGNSLGALPAHVAERMQHVIHEEWGRGLIRSWNDARWIDLPQRVGGRIARLIGAAADEVVAGDSTSLNLYKLLVAAMRMRPGRRVILTTGDDFPTDLYIAQGVAELMDLEVRYVESTDEAVRAGLDGSVGVMVLSHVNYRSGRVQDMAGLTAAAQRAGALALWDLCHSAGALPVDLGGCNVDLAVGCGYKYLNGGPGAPAFAFAARRHHPALRQPLTGWHGHARPFEFTRDYESAPGVEQLLCGTPPLLSMLALESALEVFDAVDMQALRRKSMALGDLFIALVDERLAAHGFGIASPRDASVRGSQVALTHAQGYAIVQALIARGIVGDFRAPDILRFGFAPLYVGYADVFDTVAALQAIMDTDEWNQPRFLARKAVT